MKLREIASEIEYEVVSMETATTDQINYNLVDGRTVTFNPHEGEHVNNYFEVSDTTPLAPENIRDLRIEEAQEQLENQGNTIAPSVIVDSSSPVEDNIAPEIPTEVSPEVVPETVTPEVVPSTPNDVAPVEETVPTTETTPEVPTGDVQLNSPEVITQ